MGPVVASCRHCLLSPASLPDPVTVTMPAFGVSPVCTATTKVQQEPSVWSDVRIWPSARVRTGWMGKAAIVVGDVVAGQWHGSLPMRELDLEDRQAAVAEGQLDARQVELEHSAEALVVAHTTRCQRPCPAAPPRTRRSLREPHLGSENRGHGRRSPCQCLGLFRLGCATRCVAPATRDAIYVALLVVWVAAIIMLGMIGQNLDAAIHP